MMWRTENGELRTEKFTHPLLHSSFYVLRSVAVSSYKEERVW
jgi:hypothetical protein